MRYHTSIMVITLLRSYPKLEDGKRKLDNAGNPIIVFVYRVNGTKEELKEYERIQTDSGVNTIKDEHGYLWFTTNPVGVKGRLCISPNDKLYADTTALDLASAMSKRYPGALGVALAREIINEGFVASDTPAEEEKPIDNL